MNNNGTRSLLIPKTYLEQPKLYVWNILTVSPTT